MITLAVSDLDRALAFYREGLGLDSAGVIGTEFVGSDESPAGDIAMFHLDGNLILALYPRTELAKDAGVPLGPAQSGEFSIGPSSMHARARPAPPTAMSFPGCSLSLRTSAPTPPEASLVLPTTRSSVVENTTFGSAFQIWANST